MLFTKSCIVAALAITASTIPAKLGLGFDKKSSMTLPYGAWVAANYNAASDM
jgi:hypothetical protein